MQLALTGIKFSNSAVNKVNLWLTRNSLENILFLTVCAVNA